MVAFISKFISIFPQLGYLLFKEGEQLEFKSKNNIQNVCWGGDKKFAILENRFPLQKNQPYSTSKVWTNQTHHKVYPWFDSSLIHGFYQPFPLYFRCSTMGKFTIMNMSHEGSSQDFTFPLDSTDFLTSGFYDYEYDIGGCISFHNHFFLFSKNNTKSFGSIASTKEFLFCRKIHHFRYRNGPLLLLFEFQQDKPLLLLKIMSSTDIQEYNLITCSIIPFDVNEWTDLQIINYQHFIVTTTNKFYVYKMNDLECKKIYEKLCSYPYIFITPHCRLLFDRKCNLHISIHQFLEKLNDL